MPVFIFNAKTKSGRTQEGELEAKNLDTAKRMLTKQQMTIVLLKKKPTEINIPGLSKDQITEKDIVIFTRQFATMIDAGLPLVQCLSILSAQTDNKKFAKIIGEIRASVETGDTFADALRKHPKQFDNLFTNMVEAGEVGGILDVILNRLAGYIEKSLSLKKKVKSAMVYPLAIIVIAFVVVAFLMIFVIPTFADMFSQMGKTLPMPTQIVMNISNIFRFYAHYMLIGIVASVIGFKRFYKSERGKIIVDKYILKFPVFGPLIQKVSVAKFTRTLGTLITSGVPIIQGLNITARTAGNKTIEAAVLSTIESIKEGQTISSPLAKQKVFPPMVVQMIEVGESTGALDSMLSKIADFYDEEVDTAVDALTSLLEPLLMAFLGITIGFIVVAMYLPIFKMASGV